MPKPRVDVTADNKVIFDGEATQYATWEHACCAGWKLSFWGKAKFYVDGWWTDPQDFYQEDEDKNLPPICEYL